MKLLFKRSQAQSGPGRPAFRLWARFELEESETAILQRYKFNSVKLVEAIQPRLLRNSALVGFGTFLLVLGFLMGAGFQTAMVLGLLAGSGAAWFYYDRMRETIFVNDLLHGRNFDCGSVIDLARKEAWLGVVTSFLRQVMESAKHWDGTETRPIQALSKEEAKYVVIRGLAELELSDVFPDRIWHTPSISPVTRLQSLYVLQNQPQRVAPVYSNVYQRNRQYAEVIGFFAQSSGEMVPRRRLELPLPYGN